MPVLQPDPGSIRAVAFDLDGTLVDSRLDFPAIRAELGFPDGVGLLEHLATLDDPEQVAWGNAVIAHHEMHGAACATWMPGANTLLERLREHGVPTAILTRNMRPAVELVSERLGLDVDLVLSREDCAPKPAPDGLLQIAAGLAVRPVELVYVGDFLFDLQAARAAGSVSCLYRTAENADYATSADWVIDHFDEFAEAYLSAAGRR